MLRGRKVLVWPDDDAPGLTYGGKVCAMLAALDCDFSMIDAYALARIAPGGGTREPSKKGWDAADAITEWHDIVALRRAAVNCAKPFRAPDYISFGDFEMSDAGLHREVTRGRGDNAETDTVRMSAPFEIFGRGRDPDGRAWGRFSALARSRRTNASEIRRGRGPASRACSLCAPLAADGLEIVREQQRAFANYLSGAQPAGRVTVVERTGWHTIEGETVFVLPGECIGRNTLAGCCSTARRMGHTRRRARWPNGARASPRWRQGTQSRCSPYPLRLRDRCCTWPGSRAAACTCSGNPAEAKPHACKQPRAFGDAAAHRALCELGAQPATAWRALPRNPAIP